MSQSRRSIPPQISRLILIASLVLGSYIAARYILTPPSFGRLGFYRADAIEERAVLPVVYAGEISCVKCHQEAGGNISGSLHKTLGCEGCHGAADAHAMHSQDPAFNPPKLEPTFCLRCHARNPARPKQFPQITEPGHSEGEPCSTCHQPHKPNEEPE